MKKIQDLYVKKRIKEIENTWPDLVLGSPENFVTILDYKDTAGNIRPELAGKNIPRISKNYTDNIIKALKEMQFVINQLSKKYKQEVLDSNELTSFLEDLLEVGSWSKQTDIDKYPIASNLFTASLKILIQKAPVPLQRKLANLSQEFIDLYNLPLGLAIKGAHSLIVPSFNYQENGYVTITFERK